MRHALLIIWLLISGCAFKAGPIALAVGNAGACEVYTATNEEERWEGCTVFGGPLSEQGTAVVRGAASTARNAATAVIGAP